MQPMYVIGLDYGTDSCRVIIVNAENGDEISTAVKHFPRWKEGKYCNPIENRYRQHPLDYIETMEDAVREALQKAPKGASERVVGLSFDTTGSTPVLTDRNGTPLALLPQFSENPNAMFILWKDHTAVAEAEEINKLARQWEIDFTQYEGGIYSSEWFWAKALHVLRADPTIRNEAYAITEHCDWMTALVTGNLRPESMYRSRCAAGHKAMWHASWEGLPSDEFLTRLDPLLSGFRQRMFSHTYTCDKAAGTLTPQWAERLGLHPDVIVGVSAIDAHTGAVGAGIRANTMVRIMGTSTCDIIVAPNEAMEEKLIPGICGQVDGSVIPNAIGLEAGQSAFGDLYAWFKQIIAWGFDNVLSQTTLIDEATKKQLIQESSDRILIQLDKEASALPLSVHSIVSTDWMNGRRTPDANQWLKGAISGLTLGSNAPMIYRSLVEATAFGSKAILERFIENGVRIDEIIAIGGVSLKSPYVMQTLANVLERPIKVARVEQACAFGTAILAAVAAGVYPSVEKAQQAMGQGYSTTYLPQTETAEIYRILYRKYLQLGAFSETQIKEE